jgi:peptidoglycan/LPS O-acetylase OafA/YrhL
VFYAFLYNELPSNWLEISLLNSFHLYAIYPISPPIFNAPLVTVSTEIFLYGIYIVVANHLKSIARWFGFFIFSFGVLIVNKLTQQFFFPDTLTNIGDYWFNHSLFGFLFYWVLGAFVAELVRRNVAIPLWPIIPLWLFLMYWQTLGVDPNLKATLSDIILGIAIALVLGWIALYKKGERGILQVFGESTYSLYALHTPLFYFLFQVTWPYSESFVGAVIILTLVCLICLINYITFEKYWVNFGKKLAVSN